MQLYTNFWTKNWNDFDILKSQIWPTKTYFSPKNDFFFESQSWSGVFGIFRCISEYGISLIGILAWNFKWNSFWNLVFCWLYKWRMDLKLFWIVLKWNEHVRTRFERSKWSGFWIPRPGKSVQPRFQNHFRLNPLRSNPKNHTHTPRNQNPSGSKSNSLYPFYNFGYCILI